MNLPSPPPSEENPDLAQPEVQPRHPDWESEAELTQTIVDHWQQFRPEMFRQLRKSGSLQRIARSHAQQTIRMAEQLTRAGIEPSSAWSDAMREIALSLA